MAEKMRLDKFLSDMLALTRKEVKLAIKKGRVKVIGEAKLSPELKIEIEQTEVFFDHEPVCYKKHYYYMLNKPPGVISSTEKGQTKTVMDVLLEGGLSCPFFHELSPVGRLDKDTVGLLVFTNDGDLIHKLLSPKSHVPKKYFVRLDENLPLEAISSFNEGLDLGDFFTKPAKLQILKTPREAIVTITEGKFHQVKRMFEKIGRTVIYLKRLSMGALELDSSLSEGDFRELSKAEIEVLKNEKGWEKDEYVEEKEKI